MNPTQDIIKQQIKESGLVWDYFHKISQIPHGSFNLEAISDYIRKEAKKLGLNYKEDAIGNICVTVPATKGFSSQETIIFQAHTDMVCEKNSGTEHDFEKDPIQWQVKGGRLYAQDTTLGSDNGIGVATLLALMADKTFAHPALECLFTVDEEVGLIGAQKIDPTIITGKYLINLDNEDDGIFCIGCAGGFNSLITKEKIETETKEDGFLTTLQVRGLSGGHSGMEINKGLGNANIFIVKTLKALFDAGKQFSLVSLKGGDKSNAIPRECEAVLWSENSLEAQEIIQTLDKEFKATLKAGQDESFKLSLTEKENTESVSLLRLENSQTLIQALAQIPHGVQKMYDETLVGTSLNFASLHLTAEKGIKIVLSHRSLWKDDLLPETRYSELQNTFKNLGFNWDLNEGYLPWEPLAKSPLSDYCADVWTDLFGKAPVREVIHAGLECGVIGGIVSEKQGRELDMIAFGPTIRGAHTPEEYVEIPTVERYWVFIKALLSKFETL